MFTTKSHVIFVGKDFLVLSKSIEDAISKQKSGNVVNWQENTFESTLHTLVADLKPGKISLLLDEGTVYTVELTLDSSDCTDQVIREELLAQFKDQVPETFSDKEWDFRQIHSSDERTTFLVYTPRQDLFKEVTALFESLGFELDSFLPIQLAALDNAPASNLTSTNEASYTGKESKNPRITRLILAAVFAGLVIAGTILYLLSQS